MTVESLPEQFRKHVRSIVDTSRGMIADGKQLMPVAFLCRSDSIQPVALDFSGEDGKDKSSMMICFLAKKYQAEFIVFVSEAWMLDTTEATVEQVAGQSLEHHPNRLDVVMYTLETRHGTWLGPAEITTDAEGNRTAAMPNFILAEGIAGRFANFLAQGAVQ